LTQHAELGTQTSNPPVSLRELAAVFLRLSAIAFGGPVAHIAIAETELVTRRGWISREHYLDLIAATNLIPGPNSTETMIHVGYTLRGVMGAIVAGVCFILPSFLLTLALAILYVGGGSIPQVEALLWGIKPVIVAIIADAGYRLLRSALTTRALWMTFVASLVALVVIDVPEVVVMLGAGVVYALYKVGASRFGAVGVLAFVPLVQTAADIGHRVAVWDVFFYFLKIGSVLFGSGYVLIAYIQQDLVNTFGWLTSRELLDAVAIGQITPGPVSTTAAVVGYLVAGLPGAIAGTVGIFLPSFVFVILTAPLIPKMRRSAFMSAFLSGVNAGVVAAIGVTLAGLAVAALQPLSGGGISFVAVVLALVAVAVLTRTKINPTWLIALGGFVGLIYGTLM